MIIKLFKKMKCLLFMILLFSLILFLFFNNSVNCNQVVYSENSNGDIIIPIKFVVHAENQVQSLSVDSLISSNPFPSCTGNTFQSSTLVNLDSPLLSVISFDLNDEALFYNCRVTDSANSSFLIASIVNSKYNCIIFCYNTTSGFRTICNFANVIIPSMQLQYTCCTQDLFANIPITLNYKTKSMSAIQQSTIYLPNYQQCLPNTCTLNNLLTTIITGGLYNIQVVTSVSSTSTDIWCGVNVIPFNQPSSANNTLVRFVINGVGTHIQGGGPILCESNSILTGRTCNFLVLNTGDTLTLQCCANTASINDIKTETNNLISIILIPPSGSEIEFNESFTCSI